MPFLLDGYQTLINIVGSDNDIIFKEKEVQPPGVDGGGEIETTTMRNQIFRTKAPKHLITIDDMTLQVSYDPSAYRAIMDIVNTNTLILVRFPDGSSLAFWGWLDKFTPSSLKEGEFPLAEIKLHASNLNDDAVESEPIFSDPPAF